MDRDGVINLNRDDHVKSWKEFVFLPRTLDALRQMAAGDFVLIVTTNQAVINRKMVDEATLESIHAQMTWAIEEAGGRLDTIYYCPHKPEEHCTCRKPQPGMYLKAALEFDLDLSRSYVIGDTLRDIEAARAVGAQPILVQTGLGCDRQNGHGCAGCEANCMVTADLKSAADWICRQERVAP
jgi:D-glycero-D-manno-heptose 1,7-bisphosphate phosphatase